MHHEVELAKKQLAGTGKCLEGFGMRQSKGIASHAMIPVLLIFTDVLCICDAALLLLLRCAFHPPLQVV
jgi:hypothetical protein